MEFETLEENILYGSTGAVMLKFQMKKKNHAIDNLEENNEPKTVVLSKGKKS